MRNLLLALGLSVVVAAAVLADQSLEESIPPEELFCGAPRVVVVEIQAVSAGRATRGEPARVEARVLETVSGEGIPGVEEEWTFSWLPPGHGVDWGGAEAEAMIRRLEAEPYPGPEVGSRWILAVPEEGTGIGFTPARRKPEAERAWAVKAAACGNEEEDEGGSGDGDGDGEEEGEDMEAEEESAEEEPVEEVSIRPPVPGGRSGPARPGRGVDPGEWDALLRQARGTLRVCPDQWIQNRMPGMVPFGGDRSEPARDYFILGGRRREISEFDGTWLGENCDLRPQKVW